ncbi:MAG: hypothetical protein AAB738_02060 [Patescibacteria group bacterium]
MRELSALAVVLLMGGGTVWYCFKTKKDKITPSLTTWILFSVATSLSLATYIAGKNHNVISNIGNASDVIFTSATLLFVWRSRNWDTQTSTLNKWCLWAAGATSLFWFITKDHDASNSIAQIILLLGYLPMVRKLWISKENTESAGVWTMFWLGSVASLFPAFTPESNVFAKIYAVRAVVCVSILILLILRLKLKEEKS